MRVELLYFDGCPNWKVADDRLTQALAELGRDDVVVERHRVETPAQAEELAFTGSPTIRIDGTDPFATGQEQVGLACRVYATQAGLGGSPDTAQLLAVLS
ncbi:DF family (seleno)protein [Nocardioides lacusdianchii]|uniref:DF family (seleno)protein n=1 Tax=Nocardioides lacusdianchii TaxID=2783664 RepID=UPI001CCD2DBF|nr:thioredoxin family protein [Nocardioides lacusdianchii]